MKLKICEGCGKDYLVGPHEFDERRFCSRDCYAKERNSHKIRLVCTLCSKEYYRSLSGALRGKLTFCSQLCSNQYYNSQKHKKRVTPELKQKLLDLQERRHQQEIALNKRVELKQKE